MPKTTLEMLAASFAVAMRGEGELISTRERTIWVRKVIRATIRAMRKTMFIAPLSELPVPAQVGWHQSMVTRKGVRGRKIWRVVMGSWG